MTPIVYTLELKNKEYRETLERLVSKMANRQGFYKNVGEHLLNSTADNFKKERGPDGLPWERLMPKTIARRQKLKQTPITILRARGRLIGSLGPSSLAVTNDEASITTNVPYAAAHQFGADIEMKERVQTIHQHKDETGKIHQKFRRKDDSNFSREVTVKAHVIHLPARPFLGASKEDEKIIVEIAEDWLKAENPAVE